MGHLQRILNDLETFCSKWRVKLNLDKTWCLNFFLNSENDNHTIPYFFAVLSHCPSRMSKVYWLGIIYPSKERSGKKKAKEHFALPLINPPQDSSLNDHIQAQPQTPAKTHFTGRGLQIHEYKQGTGNHTNTSHFKIQNHIIYLTA